MDQGQTNGMFSTAKKPLAGSAVTNYTTPTASPFITAKYPTHQSAYLAPNDLHSYYYTQPEHTLTSSNKENSLQTREDLFKSRELDNLSYELKSNANLKDELVTRIKSLSAENDMLMAEMQRFRRINDNLKSQHQGLVSTNQNERLFDVEALVQQRDYFQSEYQRLIKQVQAQESFHHSKHDVSIAVNEYKKDVQSLKQSHQGDTNRLNQTIATLQLENSGLKNLRHTLESQLESMKDLKREHEALQMKAARIEAENTTLINKYDALNAALKTQSSRSEKLEAEHKVRLTQVAQENEMLKTRIVEMANAEATKTVVIGVEIDRLNSIIENLNRKIRKLEEDGGSSIENLKFKFKEGFESQKKTFEAQFGELELRFIAADSMLQSKNEENQRLILENEEFEKELAHWKDRYQLIESSHKYLVDAVDKMRFNNQIDLNISIAEEEGGKQERMSVEGKSMLKEANYFKEKSFMLEMRSLMFIFEIERLQALTVSTLNNSENQESLNK